jgi:hypothetical protein
MERDPASRRILYVAVALASLWGLWAVVYEATGFPGLNYLAFGFVSLPVGVTLLGAGFLGYIGARKRRRATTDAVAAMFVAVGIAVVPFAALLQLADYS